MNVHTEWLRRSEAGALASLLHFPFFHFSISGYPHGSPVAPHPAGHAAPSVQHGTHDAPARPGASHSAQPFSMRLGLRYTAESDPAASAYPVLPGLFPHVHSPQSTALPSLHKPSILFPRRPPPPHLIVTRFRYRLQQTPPALRLPPFLACLPPVFCKFS